MTALKNRKPNVGTNVITNVNPGRLILPKYKTFVGPWGVDNLDPSLTINGTTVTPTFRYKGGDANSTDWDAWTYGETLTRQVVGVAPTYNDGSPGLGANDDSCLFNLSDYYAYSADTSFADLGTDDFAIEVIWKSHTAATNTILAHKKDGGNAGWQIQDRDDYQLRLVIEDDSSNTINLELAAVTPDTWNHGLFFVDRNGASWGYVNGAGSNMGDPSAVGDMDSGVTIAFGAANTGVSPYDSDIAYIALWQSTAGWLDSGRQDTIAAQRNAQLWGNWPHTAAGTKQATFTRAFAAYSDKIESGYRKYYYVGSETPRMCHRQDSNGVNVRGYLSETQATNIAINNEAFASWTKLDTGDTVTNNAIMCPDGRIVASSCAADTSTSAHGLRFQPTLTADTYAYSVFAKPGIWDWLLIWNVTTGTKSWFNISTGTKGTFAGSGAAYIEGPFYGGFYRCCIVFTGSAATHDLRFYLTDANNVDVVAGTGSINTYLWGAQCELGDYMTSPIITSGATATRLKDQNQAVAGDNIGGEDRQQGTIFLDCLLPNIDNALSKWAFSINDGGSSADRVYGVALTNDHWSINSRASLGSNGASNGSIDIFDNTKHELKSTWKTDNLISYTDDVAAAADTSSDMPDALDQLRIGNSYAGGSQFNGLIQNFRIYDEPLDSDPEEV